MVLIKLFISLILYLAQDLNAQEQADIIKYEGRSSTRIMQTYRFDELPDDGSYTIKMNNISGNVNVVGHEGSGAKITITNITFGIAKEEVKKAHKLSRTIVNNLEDQEIIQIIGEHNKPNNIYIENVIEMELPMNVNLMFELLGGDIDVNGIEGESILETLGGDIRIKDYKGRVDTKTNGGDMDLTMLDGILRGHSFGGNIKISRSKGNLSSSSIGGNINMEDLSGKIESQTSGGSINLLDIAGTEISCHASGGSIDCNNISGQINIKNSGQGVNIKNANGNLDVQSNGGSILIDESNGPLKCEASIGDIKMLNIAGRVESLNSNGDIFLELLYDSSIDDLGIHLETHSGDITIDIPKGLPGNINSTIYQSSSVKDINSEMPLNVSTFQDKVVGTRKIKDGTIPINLEVHGGIITIKER